MAPLEPELLTLLRAFASLIQPKLMSFPKHLSSSLIHTFFLNSILLNPLFEQYPPSKQYQKTFWKWGIHHLELLLPDENFDELDPRIYEHYLSLFPLSGSSTSICGEIRSRGQGFEPQSPPSPSYVTHFWSPSMDLDLSNGPIELSQFETITLLESRTMIESGTTGLRTWPASFALSQYLINHPGLIGGKNTLELGSGVGFLGIIVTRLQQFYPSSASPSAAFWMTDVNEDVLVRCRDNMQIQCNRTYQSPNVNYRILDWADSLHPEKISALTILLQKEINADLILGADLIFDPALIPALVGVLKLALQPARPTIPKVALIAATIRNESTFAQFLDIAKEQGLHANEQDAEVQGTTFMQNTDDVDGIVKIIKITL